MPQTVGHPLSVRGRIVFENEVKIRAGSGRRCSFCAKCAAFRVCLSRYSADVRFRSGKESQCMKSDDAAMLREVQKKSSTALKAIQAISEYVDNADLSRMLFGQSKIIENIRNRAVESLMEGGEQVRQESIVSQTLVSSSIHMNTMLNTSTSHIAELMIKNHQKGVTGMWRAMNRYDTATDRSVELAQELADFEESCIERMRPYL